MRKLRLALWGAVAVALLVYIGLSAWRGGEKAELSGPSNSTAVSFSPVFSLIDHHGKTVTEDTYLGKWLLVFFGFTNCPDICPTTLSELANVMDQLGPGREAVKPLFISVDPERDRVDSMAEYVAAFHPSIVGLTGTEEQVASATKAFNVYFEKQPKDGAQSNYAVAHTSAVHLISPQGVFVRTFGYGTAPDAILADLKERM